MNILSLSTRMLAAGTLAFAMSTTASAQIELATNGGFETGDFTGWQQFGSTSMGIPGPTAEQVVTTDNPSSGTYAGSITNPTVSGVSLFKQANVGVGQVDPGDIITIKFDARGSLAAPGGVAFAEFFTEIDGGGTSSSVILGGAPLALNPDSAVWTSYEYTAIAGPDTSGGVTLQLTATNGPAPGTNVVYDNISISVPEPASMALVGLGGLAMLARRRRQA